MQLSQDAIQEFKKIYREEHRVTLTNDQALELATSFFNLMQACTAPCLMRIAHANTTWYNGRVDPSQNTA